MVFVLATSWQRTSRDGGIGRRIWISSVDLACCEESPNIRETFIVNPIKGSNLVVTDTGGEDCI